MARADNVFTQPGITNHAKKRVEGYLDLGYVC